MSVSNPKSKYVAYLSVLSQISNCQGLGRKNKHEVLKTDRTTTNDTTTNTTTTTTNNNNNTTTNTTTTTTATTNNNDDHSNHNETNIILTVNINI